MSRFFEALERAEKERSGKPSGEESVVAVPTPDDLSIRPRANGNAERTMPPNGSSAGHVVDLRLDQMEPRLVSLLAPTTFAAEQYRTLRHIIEEKRQEAGLRTIAVSSPAPGDGKSVTAINLAGALAQARDTRVLLIDADLRNPGVSKHLGIKNSGGAGLVSAITGGRSLDDVVQICPLFNLSIVSAGSSTSVPYELLKSARLAELINEARSRFDYIVFDSPPFVPFPDCRLIEAWIDGFILVVAADRTAKKLIDETIKVINPEKIIGLVFNMDNQPAPRYRYHYQYNKKE